MKRLLQKHQEFLLYALFGIGTVAADVGLYSLLVERVGIRWANAWGWLGAVLFAFFTNKYFVFRTGAEGNRAFWREFAEFVGVRLLSLLVEVHGVDYLVRRGVTRPILGITGGVAKVIVTVIVIIINYVLSKFFVFRGGEAGR